VFLSVMREAIAENKSNNHLLFNGFFTLDKIEHLDYNMPLIGVFIRRIEASGRGRIVSSER